MVRRDALKWQYLPTKRQKLVVLSVIVGLPLIWYVWAWLSYPSDRTVEGAYLRVMSAVNQGEPKDFFAYIETRAQHACYTIKKYRKQAYDRVLSAYPEKDATKLAEKYKTQALAPDGADVFAYYAKREGWLDRLRRDMSGIAKIEVVGERATLETVKGTRYPFRRRNNGIWGLTLFTPALVAEAERAARDYELIAKAAKDYERARAQPPSGSAAR